MSDKKPVEKKKYNYTTKTGRPTDYSPELAQEICDLLATDPRSLTKLCDTNSHWPHWRTVYKWRLINDEFRQLYDAARRAQVDVRVDDCENIAENADETNSVSVNKARLIIDTRKWAASKLASHVYGGGEDEKNKNKQAESLVERFIEKIAR